MDALKYVATACGILIAMYSAALREYVKTNVVKTSPEAMVLLFTPLMLWLGAVAGTVLGVYPRRYRAVTDHEKEIAVLAIRSSKRFWVRLVLILFLLGLVGFVYITSAKIVVAFPFK